MRELDFLNRRIKGPTEQEQDALGAALGIEKPHPLMDKVNLSCNLDKVMLYTNASDYSELGKAVPEREKIEILEEQRQCVDDE